MLGVAPELNGQTRIETERRADSVVSIGYSGRVKLEVGFFVAVALTANLRRLPSQLSSLRALRRSEGRLTNCHYSRPALFSLIRGKRPITKFAPTPKPRTSC